MDEIWKDIPNYEGIYEASTCGRIRTKTGKTTLTQRHGVRCWKSRVLKPKGMEPHTGYRVSLWKNGKPQDWLVARLVAMTFLGIPKTGLTVNHKDLNRLNNNIENLEWLSLGDNIRHGFENGAYPQVKIKLIDPKGIEIFFRSLSQASKFLDRNDGYVSGQIKCNREIRNAVGELYRHG